MFHPQNQDDYLFIRQQRIPRNNSVTPNDGHDDPTSIFNITEATNNKRVNRRNKNSDAPIAWASENPSQIDVDEAVPGLQHVCDSKKPIWHRCLWGAILIFCCFGCIYQVTSRILLYWTTKTIFATVITINETIRYPSITICGYKHYATSKQKRRFVEQHNLTEQCPKGHKMTGFEGMNIDQMWKAAGAENFINSTEFPLAEILEPDQEQIEKETFASFHGYCQTIHLEKNLIKYEQGSFTLFKIRINEKGPCDYQYIKIRVHPSTESVRHTISWAAMEVTPGINTDVVLAFTKIVFLNKKKDPCVDENTFNQCYDQCIDNYIASNITRCRLPFMKSSLPLCNKPELVEESMNKADEIYKSNPRCPQCSRKCIEERYTMILSPWETGSTMTEINVFYGDNLFSTAVEMFDNDLLTCLAEVGGNLGLFLGLCLPNLIDIAWQVVEGVILIIIRKIRND